MAGMERFTQRARRVLSLAHQEAERTGKNSIHTEHLLVGLMLEEGGVAGRTLRELGMTTERVREVVWCVTTPSENIYPSRVELASDTQQVLEHSVEEARRLGHRDIGTKHILLGVVRVAGTAMEVLKRLGIHAEQIRRQTRHVLNETAATSQNISSGNLPGSFNSRRSHPVLILHGQEDQRNTITALIPVLMFDPVLIDNHPGIELGLDLLDRVVKDVELAILILANDPKGAEPELKVSGLMENIVYELGYFRGKLGSKHVCVFYQDNFREKVETWSAITGVVFIPFDKAGAWMTQLTKTIQDIGLRTSP